MERAKPTCPTSPWVLTDRENQRGIMVGVVRQGGPYMHIGGWWMTPRATRAYLRMHLPAGSPVTRRLHVWFPYAVMRAREERDWR